MDAMRAAQLSAQNEPQEIKKIFRGIELQAKEGLYCLDIPGKIDHENTRNELRRLGYKLKKEGVYERISWEHNKPK